jgi:hypothetical protein
MTDVLKSVKKIFTVSVVGATMLWSVGVSALLPSAANAAVCPTLAAGDMIKVSGKAAIYSVNKDLKVLYFPSGDEFKSWNENNSYGGYVTVTQECFDSLPVPSAYPGAVNYRAGSYVVKRPSSDQLYVVLPGNSLAKISTTDAAALYGASYKVMTVADAFWPHYVNRGSDVAGTVHEGMLVSKDGKTWYVAAGNVLREVTATGMTANRFKSAFVHAVPAAYLAGTTVGSPLAAMESVLTNRTQDGAIVSTPVTGGNLSVTLAADNPAAGNIADGSAYNKVLKLNLSASAATQVTGVTLTKTGLIANSNITGVSVWDAAGNRHGDVMTSLTSDNKITVSFGSYPILVGAGASESLTVAVNIAPAANSGLVGFSLAAATDVASNGTVGGSFPIVGNQMAIIDGNASLASTTLSGLSVGGSSSQPASTASGNLQIGDVQKEVAKFRFTEQSGNEDVAVSKMTFYVAGTIQDGDLANWSVYAPSGDKLGMTAAMSNRYVTVNFTSPYVVPKSTSRDFTVKVDVVNGSTRNFQVQLQSDYDVMMKGVTTGFYVLPANFTTAVSSTNGWFNMGSGTLTINKAATSPSGHVSAGAQNIVLAKFDVKAAGEGMELRKMGLGVDRTGSSGAAKTLTGNVVVRDATDGTVYLTVAGTASALYAGGSQYTLSSYLNLTAGQTKSLEVVGSIDATATSGHKYQVQIGNFYGKRLSTLDFADSMPTSGNTSTAANQLTVNATSLSCYKDTSMGNETRATGSTAVIGKYICTAGTSEDVRLSGLTFAFNGTSGQAANSFQNMALWDATSATEVQLGTTVSTVASSSNSYTFDLTVPKSQTKVLKLKAYVVPGYTGTMSSSISSGSYVGKDSNNTGSISTAVTGQTITIGSGTLNITSVTDATTISKVYGPEQTGVQLGKWKFAANNDDVALSKLTLQAVYANGSGAATTLGTFGSLALYEDGGSTALATASFVNGDVVFNNFSSNIAINSYKVYVLKGDTNASGVITNNTTTQFVVKSDSNTDMEARAASGSLLGTAEINYNQSTTSGVAESNFATSTAYLFHDAYPTVASESLGTALFVPGAQTQIFKFSVTNSGKKDLRLASTTVSVTVTGLVSNDSVSDFRLYSDNGGSLGDLLAQNSGFVTSTTSTSNPLSVNFNTGNDQNSLLDNLVVAPGTKRTFIVTANTLSATVNKTSGKIYISSKITGSTGWSGTTWNTGNLFYFYTPTNGSEQGAYSASNSYEVLGPSLEYSAS